MIFLGAGASKEFGIPTLQEFSKDVFDMLTNLGHENIINNIVASLNEYDLTIDFESLYAILQALKNPYQSIRNSGAVTAYFSKKDANLPRGYNYDKVLGDLRRIIYEKCSLKDSDANKIVEVYDQLFSFGEGYEELLRVENANINSTLTKILVTTNYDMSLELYLMNRQRQYLDGYVPRLGNPLVKDFNPNLLKSILIPNSPIWSTSEPILLKLHGSIWQFIQNNSMIKTIVNPQASPPIPINVEKEMLIYPTKEKEILSRNYYPFFHVFKEIRPSIMIVIGYSFRDEPINTTIVENLRRNPKSRLVVFNPNAEQIIQNINMDHRDPQLILIPQKFGTPSGKKALETMHLYGDLNDRLTPT